MKFSNSKEIDTKVKRLIRRGWTFKKGKNHGHVRAPWGIGILIIPSTPSDWRSFQNFERDLRRIMSYKA